MRIKLLFACAVGCLISTGAPAAPGRTQVCTLEYVPVCGVRHGVAKIYPNSCVAQSRGARVVMKGRCLSRPVSVRG